VKKIFFNGRGMTLIKGQRRVSGANMALWQRHQPNNGMLAEETTRAMLATAWRSESISGRWREGRDICLVEYHHHRGSMAGMTRENIWKNNSGENPAKSRGYQW